MKIKHVKDSLGVGVVGQVSHDLSMNQSHSRRGVICFHHPQVYVFLRDSPGKAKLKRINWGSTVWGNTQNKKIMLYSYLTKIC